MGSDPLALAMASMKSLAVRAKNWSESAHEFLKHCADAGNLEACYILGMVGGVSPVSFLVERKDFGDSYSVICCRRSVSTACRTGGAVRR